MAKDAKAPKDELSTAPSGPATDTSKRDFQNISVLKVIVPVILLVVTWSIIGGVLDGIEKSRATSVGSSSVLSSGHDDWKTTVIPLTHEWSQTYPAPDPKYTEYDISTNGEIVVKNVMDDSYTGGGFQWVYISDDKTSFKGWNPTTRSFKFAIRENENSITDDGHPVEAYLHFR